MSEFQRTYDARQLPAATVRIEADPIERAALAARFGVVSVDRLSVQIVLTPDGSAVLAHGTLEAAIVQSCAVSGEDLPATIAEPIALRFIPAGAASNSEEEVEIDPGALDEIEMEPGGRFDLGEAVAQSLGLAIDPFAVGPSAEEARREAGLLDQAASGPFAALAALRKP